jgi:hypothetical protein
MAESEALGELGQLDHPARRRIGLQNDTKVHAVKLATDR